MFEKCVYSPHLYFVLLEFLDADDQYIILKFLHDEGEEDIMTSFYLLQFWKMSRKEGHLVISSVWKAEGLECYIFNSAHGFCCLSLILSHTSWQPQLLCSMTKACHYNGKSSFNLWVTEFQWLVHSGIFFPLFSCWCLVFPSIYIQVWPPLANPWRKLNHYFA